MTFDQWIDIICNNLDSEEIRIPFADWLQDHEYPEEWIVRARQGWQPCEVGFLSVTSAYVTNWSKYPRKTFQYFVAQKGRYLDIVSPYTGMNFIAQKSIYRSHYYQLESVTPLTRLSGLAAPFGSNRPD